MSRVDCVRTRIEAHTTVCCPAPSTAAWYRLRMWSDHARNYLSAFAVAAIFGSAVLTSPPGHASVAPRGGSGPGATVLLSTYVGIAEEIDVVTSVGADRRGNVVLTGYGSAEGIPAVPTTVLGPGDGNPWIVRLDADGQPISKTFLGGSGRDRILDVDIDDAGYVYVIGLTESADFPTARVPVFSHTLVPGVTFIAKLDPECRELVYTAFVGTYSSSGDPVSIAVSPDGAACFATSALPGPPFQLVNPIDDTVISGRDVYTGRIDAAGERFDYITLLGGSPDDIAQDIAVDREGSAYVVGTTSNKGEWPLVNPAMEVPESTQTKGFIAKISSDGSRLVYSSVLGGRGGDWGRAVAVNDDGEAFVGGRSSNLFPITTFLDPVNQALDSAYVLKLSADGGRILWATSIVKDGSSAVDSLALDGDGFIYATGSTGADEIPLVAAFQQRLGHTPGASSEEDLFIVKLTPSGRSLSLCSYYGGGGPEYAESIAVTPIGTAYVTGFTKSPDLPLENSWRGFPGVPVVSPMIDGFVLAFRLGTPPTVRSAEAVERPGRPFRVVLRGTGLVPGVRVYIGDSTTAWANVKLLDSKAVLKGGAALEALFPAGVAVTLRIVAADGAGTYATVERAPA